MKNNTEPKTKISPAGFWPRLAARIIDDALLLPPVLLAGSFGYCNPVFPLVGAILVMVPTYLCLSCLYYTILHSGSGQTIGKRLMHLKVVHKNGGPIPFDQSFGRWFVSLASGLLLGYGYLLVIWEPHKRALHDRIACTQVIQLIDVPNEYSFSADNNFMDSRIHPND